MEILSKFTAGFFLCAVSAIVVLGPRAKQPCRRRLYEATNDARLVALDAANGKPCADFGVAGVVSLRDVADYEPGIYHMTSPPAIIDGLVVVGSGINDNAHAKMASGA